MNSSRKKSWTWLKNWLSCTALANEIRVPLSVILLLTIGKTEKKGTAAVMIKSCVFWRRALVARGYGHNHECHPASLSYYFLFAEIWKHYTIRQELKRSEDHREHTVSAVFFSHPATTLTNPSCSGAHYGLSFLLPEVFLGGFSPFEYIIWDMATVNWALSAPKMQMAYRSILFSNSHCLDIHWC